jgi:hypothetical protein
VVLQGPQVGGRGHAAERSEVDGQVERGRNQQPAHEYPPDEPEVAQFGPPPVVVAEAPELVAPVSSREFVSVAVTQFAVSRPGPVGDGVHHVIQQKFESCGQCSSDFIQ